MSPTPAGSLDHPQNSEFPHQAKQDSRVRCTFSVSSYVSQE